MTLEHANHVRRERRRLRAHVAAMADPADSRRLVAQLLFTSHPELHRMPAFELLMWARLMHPSRAERMLGAAGATTAATVGQLTVRQRTVLSRLLRGGDAELRAAENGDGARWPRQRQQDA